MEKRPLQDHRFPYIVQNALRIYLVYDLPTDMRGKTAYVNVRPDPACPFLGNHKPHVYYW